MTDPDQQRRFTALYDEHHQRVYAYAVSRAGRQVADEVVSETFIVAWRRIGDVPHAALPWLLGVARNVLRERFREEARRRSLDEEMRGWAARAAPEPDVADDVADRAALLRALAALPDADREVLTLVAWHGLTSAEAAKVVGCSAPTFAVRLHRARKRLQHALDEATAPSAPALRTVSVGEEPTR